MGQDPHPTPNPPDGECPGGVSGDCPGTPFPGIGECLEFQGFQPNGNGLNGKPQCCRSYTKKKCCK